MMRSFPARLQAWYLAIASLPCVRSVCEIGFNAGHSSTVCNVSSQALVF